MIRRFGEPIQQSTTYKKRPGAYAILERDGAILLTYQMAPHHEFQLPGGGIDPGESPVRALYREVFEETGWHITKPRRLGAFRRFTYMPEYDLSAEKICQVYYARPTLAICDPPEPEHLAVWMPVDQAIEAVENDGDRAFLIRYFSG
ncbi:NUDIX domain-containing protein [Parasulfitobacter algicola]|uniref:NUDIX hydrolase n=1 Tax=Parasulfitobacter algicola TaxID=2614809 RepID=A0ABX2INL8_9RHOB|nr:NUDIX hydrolase [Sulfitobacter algicola]NSX53561.1 NUDIX hydrolase [Sulfitobacter algicola]